MRWLGFVNRLAEFFCWSMAEVTESGLGAGRIAETIDMQSNSAVTGIEKHWNLYDRRV
jgi:hypothetical protein